MLVGASVAMVRPLASHIQCSEAPLTYFLTQRPALLSHNLNDIRCGFSGILQISFWLHHLELWSIAVQNGSLGVEVAIQPLRPATGAHSPRMVMYVNDDSPASACTISEGGEHSDPTQVCVMLQSPVPFIFWVGYTCRGRGWGVTSVRCHNTNTLRTLAAWSQHGSDLWAFERLCIRNVVWHLVCHCV